MAVNISQQALDTIRSIKIEGLSRAAKFNPEQTSLDIVEYANYCEELLEYSKKLAAEVKRLRERNNELTDKLQSSLEREAGIGQAMTAASQFAAKLEKDAEEKAEQIISQAKKTFEDKIIEAKAEGEKVLQIERLEKEKALERLAAEEQKTQKRIIRNNAQVEQTQRKLLDIMQSMAAFSSQLSEAKINLAGEPVTTNTLNVTFSSTSTGADEIVEEIVQTDVAKTTEEISNFIKINTANLPKIEEIEEIEEINEINEIQTEIFAKSTVIPLPSVSDDIISEVSQFENAATSISNTQVIPIIKDEPSFLQNPEEPLPTWKKANPLGVSEEIPEWKKISNTVKQDFSNLKFGTNL